MGSYFFVSWVYQLELCAFNFEIYRVCRYVRPNIYKYYTYLRDKRRHAAIPPSFATHLASGFETLSTRHVPINRIYYRFVSSICWYHIHLMTPWTSAAAAGVGVCYLPASASSRPWPWWLHSLIRKLFPRRPSYILQVACLLMPPRTL